MIEIQFEVVTCQRASQVAKCSYVLTPKVMPCELDVSQGTLCQAGPAESSRIFQKELLCLWFWFWDVTHRDHLCTESGKQCLQKLHLRSRRSDTNVFFLPSGELTRDVSAADGRGAATCDSSHEICGLFKQKSLSCGVAAAPHEEVLLTGHEVILVSMSRLLARPPRVLLV